MIEVNKEQAEKLDHDEREWYIVFKRWKNSPIPLFFNNRVNLKEDERNEEQFYLDVFNKEINAGYPKLKEGYLLKDIFIGDKEVRVMFNPPNNQKEIVKQRIAQGDSIEVATISHLPSFFNYSKITEIRDYKNHKTVSIGMEAVLVGDLAIFSKENVLFTFKEAREILQSLELNKSVGLGYPVYQMRLNKDDENMRGDEFDKLLLNTEKEMN